MIVYEVPVEVLEQELPGLLLLRQTGLSTDLIERCEKRIKFTETSESLTYLITLKAKISKVTISGVVRL